MNKLSRGWLALLAVPAAMLLTKGLASLTGVLFFGTMGVYLSQITITCLAWGIWPLILKSYRWGKPGNKPMNLWPGCLLAVIAGVTAQWILGYVTTGWIRYIGLEPGGTVPVPETWPEWLVGIPTLVIIPAIAEEWFFRGMLLRGLNEGLGTVAAAVLVTVIFAVSHGSVSALPANLIMGSIGILLAIKGGRIRYCILFHAVYNLTAVLMMRS